MKKINVFLGGNENFFDNQEALSIKALNDNFYDAMNGYRAMYEIGDSSSMLSDPKLKMESIIGKIMECHLCILDITSIVENKKYAKFIEKIYRACIKLDKKMILLHHFAYPIDDWVKIAKEENVLQVLEHDGNRVSEELSTCLHNFFEQNQNRQTVIPLDDNNCWNIVNLLDEWQIANEIEIFEYYLNIYFKSNEITICYQEYNTITLFQLVFDLSNMSEENQKYVVSILERHFQASYNIFFHDDRGKQIQKEMR